MTETVKLALTLAVTLVGSGLGTTIVGTLFKQRFDHKLETHKSLLLRNSRIHERQVDALLLIHSKLEEALFYLQRVASAGRLAGEASDSEFVERMGKALAAASREFSQNKLLLSPALSDSLGQFFDAVLSAHIELGAALNPMFPDGEPRAERWGSARDIAYKRLPSILQLIETEARGVIHGVISNPTA